MRPDQAGETVFVLGEAGRDSRDKPLPRPVIAEIKHCVVSPAGDQVVKGDGFVHGDVSKYQILAPPGTSLKDGDVVRIRGEEFTVDPIQGFDYSVGRRPVLGRRHRPKVLVTVSRGEVSGNVA